jgi:putative addiction module killer protein
LATGRARTWDLSRGRRHLTSSNQNVTITQDVGKGVPEYKIDFGSGYHICLGKDGERLVILIGGGTKKRQDNDIAAAQVCWADYKRRKKHAPYP